MAHTAQLHIYMAQIPLLFLSPCWLPFVPPLYPLLLTWHPPSCDRNRAPPFTHPTPPVQIPRTPTVQRLTKTTSGIFRLLLSGTISSVCFVCFDTGPKHQNKPKQTKKKCLGFVKKQTEKQTKQIEFQFVSVRTEKKNLWFQGPQNFFEIFSVCFGLFRENSVCFGCFDTGPKQQ